MARASICSVTPALGSAADPNACDDEGRENTVATGRGGAANLRRGSLFGRYPCRLGEVMSSSALLPHLRHSASHILRKPSIEAHRIASVDRRGLSMLPEPTKTPRTARN
jgi:hypothetical protein